MVRDITRSENYIVEYLERPPYSSRNLESRHLNQDSYDPRVEIELRDSRFYHISQIGRLVLHNALINALIERWRPETHTFHLPHGECTITLEDVAMIFGLPIDGMLVSEFIDSSTNGLENEFMTQFGIVPTAADHKGSSVKLAWLRTLKRRMQLDIALGSQMALCQASRYDCKEVDGPLSLLCIWAWERLPFLAPVRLHPSFPLVYRRLLDDIPADGFVWNPYIPDHIENIVVPNDILQHRLMWSAVVPLISFECIKWHASDRVMWQFGLAQEVPGEATRLVESHNVVLTGPKNKDWRVEHSGYIMSWTNRLSSVLVGDPTLHHQASDRYMQWYTEAYGTHLRLTGYVPQPQPQAQPQPQPQPIIHPYQLPTSFPHQYPYTQPNPDPGPSFFSQLFPDSHSLHMPPYQGYYRPFMSQHVDIAAQSSNHQLYQWVAETETSQWVPQHSQQSPQIALGRSSVDSRLRRRSPSLCSGSRRSVDSIQSLARGIGRSNAINFSQVQAPMTAADNNSEDDSEDDSNGNSVVNIGVKKKM
ncbi:uncharacterized protein DS421_9g284580 [Arachis hypogaea]|nr:uncharacterized protein DS421_9g284580 [Arachis hypogaea]